MSRNVPRFGLRVRVALAFALGALALAVAISGLVIGVTRNNLLEQRADTSLQQVYLNADKVRSGVRPDGRAFDLASLQTPDGSRPILFERLADAEQRWTARDPEYGRDALPDALRERVLEGVPAKMRYVHPTTDQTSLAIGIPMPSIDGAYFEIVSLRSLDETLTSVSFTLVGASILTVIASALLGWYASRRILRPLGAVGRAATALAGGDLGTRIASVSDPDLEPIITSFNTMASTLEARIEKDTQFASDVSHELRSPLMTLQASVEVLENNRDELSERARAALDLLSADLDRFRELVEDLLEISRFDAGAVQLEMEEVLLGQFVEAAVRATGLRVPVILDPNLDVSDELGDVLTALDSRRIARVIANLLTNAEKYGGGARAVHVGTSDDGARVVIMVDDDGPGVPEGDRLRIFERFNRAGAANQRGTGTGVGLGLALVAEHMRLHEGDVWVTDAPGGGARFVVELPRIELPDGY